MQISHWNKCLICFILQSGITQNYLQFIIVWVYNWRKLVCISGLREKNQSYQTKNKPPIDPWVWGAWENYLNFKKCLGLNLKECVAIII